MLHWGRSSPHLTFRFLQVKQPFLDLGALRPLLWRTDAPSEAVSSAVGEEEGLILPTKDVDQLFMNDRQETRRGEVDSGNERGEENDVGL